MTDQRKLAAMLEIRASQRARKLVDAATVESVRTDITLSHYDAQRNHTRNTVSDLARKRAIVDSDATALVAIENECARTSRNEIASTRVSSINKRQDVAVFDSTTINASDRARVSRKRRFSRERNAKHVNMINTLDAADVDVRSRTRRNKFVADLDKVELTTYEIVEKLRASETARAKRKISKSQVVKISSARDVNVCVDCNIAHASHVACD